MTREDLDAEMRSVLIELAVISHVPAAGYEPKGRSRATDSVLLSSDPRERDHTYFAARYGPPFHHPTPRAPGCQTDEQRAEVITWARGELRAIRGTGPRPQPVGETIAERDARIVKEGEGFTRREVAIRFRCGERDVTRARKNAGREPDLGRQPEEGLPADQRRGRVLKMKQNGMTPAQIARLLGVHRSTVERDLGLRAA